MARERFRRFITRRSLWGWLAGGAFVIWRGFDHWGNAEFFLQKWTQTIWPAIVAATVFIKTYDTWFQFGLLLSGLAWLLYVATRPEPRQEASPKPSQSISHWGQPVSETLVDVDVENERQKIRERIEKEELEKFREELRKKAEENRIALAKRAAFDYLEFCWEVRPRFFDIYRTVDNPSDDTLDDAIRGPLCPNCGRALTVATHGDWMSSYELFYSIENPCSKCGHQGPAELESFSYFQIKLEIYKEAQRLASRGEAFPSGRCSR